MLSLRKHFFVPAQYPFRQNEVFHVEVLPGKISGAPCTAGGYIHLIPRKLNRPDVVSISKKSTAQA